MKHNATRRAANAVEFALALPVFLVVLFGIIEYGWFFQQQLEMVAVVREAVRAGVLEVQVTEPGPVGQAEAVLAEGLTEAGYSGEVYVDVYLDGEYPDELLVVSAEVPYNPLLGIVPAPSAVGSTIVMRLYDQRAPPSTDTTSL